MIREATESDMPELVRMARHFHSLTSYSSILPFCQSSFETAITNFISSPEAEVLVADGGEVGRVHGMVAGILSPQWWNHSLLTGQELFWWVDEDARAGRSGIGLLVAIESWAKERGAKAFSMIHTPNLAPKRLEKFYRKRGYREWDHVWTKEM